MKRFEGWEAFPQGKGTAVTIGTFDGVHLGHQKIIESTVQAARESGGKSVVISFTPHPQHVLNPQAELKLLSSSESRARDIETLGLDLFLEIPFDKKLASMSPEAFVKDILVDKLQLKRLIVGFNHAFGKSREGHEDNLRTLGEKLGFSVSVIPPVLCDGQPVSSTRIRQALIRGDVNCARNMLGRSYKLRGSVIAGNSVGNTIGFPTANLALYDENQLKPADGVYAVLVQVRETWYQGMANIGARPSIDSDEHTIEAHLFDFGDDLYGSEITIAFEHRIRDEIRFDSMEVLKAQLMRDQSTSLGLLNKNHQ